MIRTGTILSNRYEILEQIGSGGMAYVYKARDRKLSRLVAIKILKEEFCKDKSFVAKFRMEAQAAAGLSHNNVVGVYDVGEENNTHYIVMELIDGITLKEYITRKRKLGTKESIGIAIQVAQGLEAAHKRHIVHRDIKPQNIIISKDGRIKVADFGIARAITDETTNLYGAAGSVHYISPEQARGGYCDERSDIYSLGITIYEMVTGRVPFDGDTTVAVAIAHINEAMVPPSNIEPSVPVALEQIIFKCTQKRPNQRYSSCADLIKDLRHALVAPNERFVHFVQLEETAKGETTVMSDEQMRDIRNRADGPLRESQSHQEKAPKSQAVKRSSAVRESAVAKQHRQQNPPQFEAYDDHSAEEQFSERAYRKEEYNKKKQSNRKVKRDPDETTMFDKILAGIGSVLGVAMLVMLVYIVGSLSGAFQRTPASVSSNKNTNISKDSDPAVSTYEDESGQNTDERAKVPNLLGMSITEATKALKEAGLKIVLARTYEYSDEYATGLVCRQQYDEGIVVDRGSSIKVYLSLGSDKFEINSKLYINGNVNILKYYLRSFKDIDVEYIGEYSETYAKDMVLRMEPDKGYLKAGDSLKVYISLGPEYIDVPNLYGMSRQQAIAKIEQAGFKVGTISEVNSDSTDVGLVCGQSLDPDSSQKSGTEIDFSISLGPKMAVVPGVVGNSAEGYAYSTIGAANLYYSVEYQDSMSVPAGTVISQVPEGGASVPEFSTVKLIVSSGAPTVSLDSGALTNMSQDQAASTLASMSLGVQIQYESSNYVAVGNVTRWAPTSADGSLHAGDTVIIYISTGPEATTPSTDPNPAPSSDPVPAPDATPSTDTSADPGTNQTPAQDTSVAAQVETASAQ